MALNLFGYEISKSIKKASSGSSANPEVILKSIVPKEAEDGSQTISAGGYFGQYIDIDGTTVASDQDLILKYRNAAQEPETDHAINCIVDEAIISGDESAPVTLSLNDLNYSEDIKKKIFDEFDHLLRLLEFNQKAADIFRQWYVDGRSYYHIIIDSKNPGEGIQELRYVDPMKMRKVREVETSIDPVSGAKLIRTTAEYYVYNEQTVPGQMVTTISSGDSIMGVKIDQNAIVYVPSGILDSSRKRVISHLHKALKPVNQLRMMEDSLVIYRISRAPERRIFYIDVGNLTKGKAEEYVNGLISKYRNKLVYDASSGQIRDDRRHMSMLEDFWLPRREGGRGTEITTLPGGDNLGQIEDILFFKKNVYKCMNVPLSRFDNESAFNVGRVTEISREEVSFQKFINRLRKKFSYLFIDLLKTQIILKGIITEEDWAEMKEKISIDFQRDNFFTELKEAEILRERLSLLDTLGDKIGKYYSEGWVRRHVLRQSDGDIDKMDEEIAKEKAKEMSAENPQNDSASSNDSLKTDDVEVDSDGFPMDMIEPDENPETFDSENQDEEIDDSMQVVEDGQPIYTLGTSGVKALAKKYALNIKTKSSGGRVNYIRVVNPKNGKSQLFDPTITTLKYFMDSLGLTPE